MSQPRMPLLDRVWSPQHAVLLQQLHDPLAINRAIEDLTWTPPAAPRNDNPAATAQLATIIERLQLTQVTLLAPAGKLSLDANDTGGVCRVYGIQATQETREIRLYITDHGAEWTVLAHDVIPTSTGPWPTETQRRRRGHRFYPDRPLHRTQATHDVPARAKIIREHYFVGGLDWWIVEAEPDTTDDASDDPNDQMVLAYGYACLNDPDMAEWGSVDLRELEQLHIRNGLHVVERNLHWEPVLARDANLPGSPFPRIT